MPSNYTIAKTLQKIVYYRQICDQPTGQFPGAALEIQSLAGVKLEELMKTEPDAAREHVNEADDEVWHAIEQICRDETPDALKEDKVPLTILELTEIKGLGGKTARKVYEELKVVDLNGLKAALEDGRLAKVKGFGPSLLEKVKAHLEKLEQKGKGKNKKA
jgi:DNA polymerase/3'-5' exonuclease PolX